MVQPTVTYHWPSSPTDPEAAAIPLMPYQPISLTASVSCSAARRLAQAGGAGEHVLLSTTPLRVDPSAHPLPGLRVAVVNGRLAVSSAGVDLGSWPVPAGSDCSWTFTSGVDRTELRMAEVVLAVREGDLRPNVIGAFTELPDATGLDLRLVTDTRFSTTIGPLKLSIAVLGVASLLVLLVALAYTDRAVRGRRTGPRAPGERRWRPGAVDVVLAAVLGLWWVIGPITVDDGYISGIVRSRGSNGFIGNVYRWLNAPEEPFSWFYELYYWWSLVSPSTVWMRLPSTLLGLVCWALLSRHLLPRLGRPCAGVRGRWTAAAVFALWWLPFNLGLRPEPWVAVGALAVYVTVERTVATGRVLPLAAALMLAGVTTLVTPTGLLAFAPILAAAGPLVRRLRERSDLHRLPLAVALLAAPASATLLVFANQSLAAVLESVRVRTVISGRPAWYAEYERYALLLDPHDIQGSLARRAPVLLTLLAVAGASWALTRRERRDVAGGPARRLVVGFVLALAAMTLSPTKFTHHFGGLAGLGAGVLVLAVLTWSRAGLRARSGLGRPAIAGLAGVTVVGALVLRGLNTWAYVSNYGLTWSTNSPHLGPVRLAEAVLGLGAVLVVGLAGAVVWRRATDRPEPTLPRWVPAPAGPALVLVIAVVALEVLGFVRVSAARPDTYTLASDAVRTLTGSSCGLQSDLSVETDPAAGTLPQAVGPAGAAEPAMPVVPVDVGGPVLPGVPIPSTGVTPWYVLDEAQREAVLPVVVTLAGATAPGDSIGLDFGSGGQVVARSMLAPATTMPRDQRVMAPPGADTVRIAINAPESTTGAGTGRRAAVSLPRVPRLTPMTAVLPPGSTAVLDWPVAFLFPCLRPEPLPLGTAGLPRWRVAPPPEDPSAEITYTPAFGGPFAGPRLLVTELRMATYLRGEPLREPAQLLRWIPVVPLEEPTPHVTTTSVPGWRADGHTRVPEVDPVPG
ncbi:arabinosyltransferase domain-containing protein [Pseudonocardia adelaidensis]|uniref:arabinosyltransferase domain-containing protein n=1 Tax=Pseudonocardia adelaidensis TaxID=648754 RepID=UPI0031E65F40